MHSWCSAARAAAARGAHRQTKSYLPSSCLDVPPGHGGISNIIDDMQLLSTEAEGVNEAIPEDARRALVRMLPAAAAAAAAGAGLCQDGRAAGAEQVAVPQPHTDAPSCCPAVCRRSTERGAWGHCWA